MSRIWRFGLAAAAAAAIVVIGIVLLTGSDNGAHLSPSSTLAQTPQNSMSAQSPGVTQAQTDVGTLVVTRTSGPNRDLYLVRSDGTGLKRLTADVGFVELACWSPDGTRIVFNAWEQDRSSIKVMNADGSGKLTLGAGMDPVSWSPDGKQILFYTDDGVAVMNADGSGRRFVGVPFTTDFETWAPNGKIVVVRVRQPADEWWKHRGDLYTVNPDGSGLQRLTKGASLMWPSVSPDGATIAAYATKTDRLITMPYRGDGPAVTLLARASRYFPNDSKPLADWAPDGKRLVVGSSNIGDEAGGGLLLVNADGSGLANVPGVTQVIGPNWRPE